jgi:GT2 family glycosyltransferase
MPDARGDSPDLSVIIVSYNTAELLDAALRSLERAIKQFTYEVIVADNASADGSVSMLRRKWPSVSLLEMGGNLGFARANNRAMALARGRYLLLMNSDAEALDGALDELIAFLDCHPEAGVAAPQLLNSDLTDQGTARAFPSAAAAVFGRKSFLTAKFPRNRWSCRYLSGRQHQGQAPFAVDWVSGACFMVRRRVVDQVGALDESYFMYWEDADWCRRIGRAGFDVFCVPAAQVVHHEGQSSRERPARLVWEFHRSAFRYYTKHHTPRAAMMDPAVGLALALRAGAIIGIDYTARLFHHAAHPRVPAVATRSGSK